MGSFQANGPPSSTSSRGAFFFAKSLPTTSFCASASWERGFSHIPRLRCHGTPKGHICPQPHPYHLIVPSTQSLDLERPPEKKRVALVSTFHDFPLKAGAFFKKDTPLCFTLGPHDCFMVALSKDWPRKANDQQQTLNALK